MGNSSCFKLQFLLKVRHSKDLKRHRFEFIHQFVEKCSIGNANINFTNVLFVSKEAFISGEGMLSFESNKFSTENRFRSDCLTQSEIILFVSHRWQDAANGKPDTSNIQFNVVKHFLETEGEMVTHIWLDFSCITQDISTDSGKESFRKYLDNIQTAIFLCDIVLVVPRLKEAKTEVEASSIFYTDLSEITRRGWCLFEVVCALLACCEIFLTFSEGPLETLSLSTVFAKVGKGLKVGSHISLHDIQSARKTLNLRSYKNAISLVCGGSFPSWGEEAKNNWLDAKDPSKIAIKILEAVKSCEKERLVSLTLNYEKSDQISSLLPDFTSDSDRAVVTNLMGNVAGFAHTGFKGVKEKTIEILQAYSAKAFFDENSMTLDISGSSLFVKDVLLILYELRSHKQKQWTLKLHNNPLGYNISKVIFSFDGPVLLSLKELDLGLCSLGDKGSSDLAAAVQLTGSVIQKLDMSWNDIGNEGAKALSGIASLTELNVAVNGIGHEGAKALGEHNSLVTLNLTRNWVGNEGAKFLAANTKLTFLQLYLNDIGDEGALAFAKNNTLTELNLMKNDSIGIETKRILRQKPFITQRFNI